MDGAICTGKEICKMKTLMQTVKESAEKARQANTQVILYAASAFCGRIARAFQNYGVSPICICDADPQKQGNTYYGLLVSEPTDVVDKYPDAFFFVTSNLHRPEIIGYLVHNLNVTPKRILNYDTVEWKKSCHYLESEAYVIADASKINFCCSDFGKQITPFVDISNNYCDSVAKFTKYRDRFISDLQNGTTESTCANCTFFKDGYYFANRKVRKIVTSSGGGCNFRCIYCINSAKHPVDLHNPDPISFTNLISEFETSGELSNAPKLIMGAGEFVIHPERSSLYRLCDNSEYILTNCSIFDENIARILENGNVALEVSVDAGDRQTFKDIKGIDCFEKVCENIKRYSENKNSSVHLKYIFLPGINDNAENVNGFLDICLGNNIDFAVISYNLLLSLNDVPVVTLQMIKLMVDGFNRNGILYADYSGLTKTKQYKALV
jgi:uncharacterized Fe-S cluster-containing radical SAM superfamily protein